jgi:plastocyanin
MAPDANFKNGMRDPLQWILACALCALALTCVTAAGLAETSTVTGNVTLLRPNGSPRTDSDTGIVVWLTPIPNRPLLQAAQSDSVRPQIIQKNKRFETRLLVVQVGTIVDFPNHDPFFHNVFSLFDGKRFDLGLYEAKKTKSVPFNKPGVCYIFCNIHSQMSSVVIVLDTPYLAQMGMAGEFRIPDVPPGRYQVNVWAERCSPDALKAVSRQITVEAPRTTVGAIQLRESRDIISVHPNKHGKDYETPVFSSPIYTQP